ncbi:MAG: dihydrofolate reductase family protein [Actinobacteria bacterium]|nr:dihydrofolate reductase family protein [Actinomycetota bacterium]
MRRLLPAPIAELSDDALRDAYAFPEQRPWVRANMVSTLDGAMRGTDSGSRSISTPADQRVFSIARADADVILVGAGTIRAEDYRPSKKIVAIVSNRLDLPLTLRMLAERTDENPRPIAFATDAAAADAADELRAVVDIVPCGADSVDLQRVIEELAARGLGHIHCEGGPNLLGDLAAAGLLDELILTVAPLLLGGGPGEHILTVAGGFDPPLRLTPTHVLEEDGSVFLRARVN